MSSTIVSTYSTNFRIYIPAAIAATAIAIVGFWPTYFGPMVAGTLQAVPMIHLHAAVFIGWLLIVIAQAALAAAGHRAMHIKVGNAGMLYGVLLIIVGIATAFSQFAARIDAGQIQEARDRLFVPLTDMMVFIPFLAAAWRYRRKPEIHKRLIVVATTILLIAAVHRMTILGPRPLAPYKILVVWLAPIYMAMLYDLIKRRLVHPVYLMGIAAILYLKFLRIPLFKSAAWSEFSGWLTRFYT
jgi:hypothetical protein